MIQVEWWVAIVSAAFVFQCGMFVGGKVEERWQREKKAMNDYLEHCQREVNAIIADIQKDHKPVDEVMRLLQ